MKEENFNGKRKGGNEGGRKVRLEQAPRSKKNERKVGPAIVNTDWQAGQQAMQDSVACERTDPSRLNEFRHDDLGWRNQANEGVPTGARARHFAGEV